MKVAKYSAAIILLISIISCQKIQTEKLIGSWKMKDLVNTTGKNIEEKTTFTKDSLLIFELISNGKIIDKEVANYSLKNNTITVKFKNQNPYDFKVLKLNNSEMELLNIKEKRAFRYVK